MQKKKTYGEIKSIDTTFSIFPDKGQWRLNKKFSGGGPLMDVGVYCIQAVCYITGMEPVAITAQKFPVINTKEFIDIEDTVEWQMEMPNGLIATCRTSYTEDIGYLKITADKGWFLLNPAYNYCGLQMQTSDNKKMELPPFSQQALQMDGVAISIKNNEQSIVPAEMGKRDVKIIEAIYAAMQSGKKVEIK